MRRFPTCFHSTSSLDSPNNCANDAQIYTNTCMFNTAEGKRSEAIIVTLLGLGPLFTSSHILPYIPTILASIVVLYIGLQLLTESLWQSSGTMLWDEWITVAGTTLSCSLLGFAQGIGIGLAISVALSFLSSSLASVCAQTSSRLFTDCIAATSHPSTM